MASDTFEHQGMTMVELKEPVFFQFKKEGDTLEGVLISALKFTYAADPKKPAARYFGIRYILDVGEGERVAFNGTTDISSKLTIAHMGYYIIVRYEGEDPSIRRGENNMRRFKVARSKAPVLFGQSLADAAAGLGEGDGTSF